MVSSRSLPWRPQISYLVFNLVISSIYTALVQACHKSPQVAHVCTIAEPRLSAIYTQDVSARTCCCLGVIVIEWMNKGREGSTPPTDLPLFLVKLAHIQPHFTHSIGATGTFWCLIFWLPTFQSVLPFRTALYLTTGNAFIGISQPWNIRFTISKKGAPERYWLVIFIQGHTQGGQRAARLQPTSDRNKI